MNNSCSNKDDNPKAPVSLLESWDELIYNVTLKSSEISMFVCNQVAKLSEILMFVCFQKDAKDCCDVTKLNGTHCADCKQ